MPRGSCPRPARPAARALRWGLPWPPQPGGGGHGGRSVHSRWRLKVPAPRACLLRPPLPGVTVPSEDPCILDYSTLRKVSRALESIHSLPQSLSLKGVRSLGTEGTEGSDPLVGHGVCHGRRFLSNKRADGEAGNPPHQARVHPGLVGRGSGQLLSPRPGDQETRRPGLRPWTEDTERSPEEGRLQAGPSGEGRVWGLGCGQSQEPAGGGGAPRSGGRERTLAQPKYPVGGPAGRGPGISRSWGWA